MTYHAGLSLDPDGGAPLVGVILANHALATFRNGALMDAPTLAPMPAILICDKPIRRLPVEPITIEAARDVAGVWSPVVEVR